MHKSRFQIPRPRLSTDLLENDPHQPLVFAGRERQQQLLQGLLHAGTVVGLVLVRQPTQGVIHPLGETGWACLVWWTGMVLDHQNAVVYLLIWSKLGDKRTADLQYNFDTLYDIRHEDMTIKIIL